MRKNIQLLLVAGLVLWCLAGCKKLTVDPVKDFDVIPNTTVVKAGTPVTFNFVGDPDNIIFYSGETGKIYDNKDRTSAIGVPALQFTSTHTAGTDQGSLKLLVSKDFNGVYDSTDVKNATWTDITSRAKLATGATATASGTIDLSDFAASGNSKVYLAFKCLSNTSTWNISNLSITNTLTSDNSVQVIADINSASWLNVNFLNPVVSWKVASSVLTAANWDGHYTVCKLGSKQGIVIGLCHARCRNSCEKYLANCKRLQLCFHNFRNIYGDI